VASNRSRQLRAPTLTTCAWIVRARRARECHGLPALVPRAHVPHRARGAYVGQWLQSFKEFRRRQKPGSFNLDRVMER